MKSNIKRYNTGNPFEGRLPNDVWADVLSRTVKTDKNQALKKIEEILEKRKISKK